MKLYQRGKCRLASSKMNPWKCMKNYWVAQPNISMHTQTKRQAQQLTESTSSLWHLDLEHPMYYSSANAKHCTIIYLHCSLVWCCISLFVPATSQYSGWVWPPVCKWAPHLILVCKLAPIFLYRWAATQSKSGGFKQHQSATFLHDILLYKLFSVVTVPFCFTTQNQPTLSHDYIQLTQLMI